jgi:hypothetical protein
MNGDFGQDNPREMPPHFFNGSVRIDYSSAVRSNAEKQNCSICPRYWYVDAVFPCERCNSEFAFTAAEQRTWYEEYAFWVDSLPKHCLPCRQQLRKLKAARQEYDRNVEQALNSPDTELKRRLTNVIDQLYELGGDLPARINENRRRLARQLSGANR